MQPSVSWYVLFVSPVSIIRGYPPTIVSLRRSFVLSPLVQSCVSRPSDRAWASAAGRGRWEQGVFLVLNATWAWDGTALLGRAFRLNFVFPQQFGIHSPLLSASSLQDPDIAVVWWLGCVISTPGDLLWPAQGTSQPTAGLGGAESASVWLNACLAGGIPGSGHGWAVASPFTFVN